MNLTSTFLVALSFKLIICYLQHNWTMKARHPIYRNYWVENSVILPINNIWLYMSIQYLPLFKVWRAGYVMIVYKLFVVFVLFGFHIKGNKTLWHITWTARHSELVKQNAITAITIALLCRSTGQSSQVVNKTFDWISFNIVETLRPFAWWH